MAGFDLQRIKDGWTIQVDSVVVEATSPHLDRGALRTALTVRRSESIVYRNTVNLTSERARARVLQNLATKDVQLDERVLIALDEACRQPKPDRDARRHDSPNVSGTVPLDLAGLSAVFERWLLIVDSAFLPVLAGAFLAHRLGGEPVWLLIVAPPGGTKSEGLRTLYDYEGVYPLSELTSHTFASGLDTPSGDASLLSRLSDEILIFKDFTTVLEMFRDERQAILAQMREIYDGRFDKAWGTGRELHWQGRLGFIAGVTPIIDRHQSVLSVLGERFVLFRLEVPDRVLLAEKALAGASQEAAMRHELAEAMHGFLNARGSAPPAVTPAVTSSIAIVADFVTRARSGVIRDGYRRELEYAPEPEAPTRLAKVLLGLASGIALAYDSSEITGRELALVLRVALDCLPVIRRRVIAALVEDAITDDGATLSTTVIAGAAQFSATSIRRSLEELQALGIVTCRKTGAGKADEWQLAPRWVQVFRGLTAASQRAATLEDESASTGEDACDGGPNFSGKVGVPETREGASHENPSAESDMWEAEVVAP